MNIDGNEAAGIRESSGNVELKTARTLFVAFAAEEQSAREIVLAGSNRATQRGHAVMQDFAGGAKREKIGHRRGRAETRDSGRSRAPRSYRARRKISVRAEEIAVQIHVVFVHAAKPGHAERIQRVNQGDGAIGQWFRDSFFQPLQLNGGTGEAFHAVQSGGMNEGAFGRGRTEPANIDCQIISIRSLLHRAGSIQFARREPGPPIETGFWR